MSKKDRKNNPCTPKLFTYHEIHLLKKSRRFASEECSSVSFTKNTFENSTKVRMIDLNTSVGTHVTEITNTKTQHYWTQYYQNWIKINRINRCLFASFLHTAFQLWESEQHKPHKTQVLQNFLHIKEATPCSTPLLM